MTKYIVEILYSTGPCRCGKEKKRFEIEAESAESALRLGIEKAEQYAKQFHCFEWGEVKRKDYS